PLRTPGAAGRHRGGGGGLPPGPRAQVPRRGGGLPGRVWLAPEARARYRRGPGARGGGRRLGGGQSLRRDLAAGPRGGPAGADLPGAHLPGHRFFDGDAVASRARGRAHHSARPHSLVRGAVSEGRGRQDRRPRLAHLRRPPRPAADLRDHRGLRPAAGRGARVRGGPSQGGRGCRVPRVPRTDPRLRLADARHSSGDGLHAGDRRLPAPAARAGLTGAAPVRKRLPLFAGVALIWLFLGLFLVYPLTRIFYDAVTNEAGAFTLANFPDSSTDRFYLRSLWNSMELGVATVISSSILGIAVAFLLVRYDFRGRDLFSYLTIIPIISPPLVGVLGFTFILGRAGTVNVLLMDWFDLLRPVNFLYGVHGVVLVETLHLFPMITLNVVDAL